MIIKKYGGIEIQFYGLKYLEDLKPDPVTGLVPPHPPWSDVHCFNFTKELLPDLCHVSYLHSNHPNPPKYSDLYEIKLHYYFLYGPSKLVLEKYLEYFLTYTEGCKSIQEMYPEIMV